MRLDKEIREACSKLHGHEEALKVAVTQLEEDVEGKLDRMELQPLKEYFGELMHKVILAIAHTMYLFQTRGWSVSSQLPLYLYLKPWEMRLLGLRSHCGSVAFHVISRWDSSP